MCVCCLFCLLCVLCCVVCVVCVLCVCCVVLCCVCVVCVVYTHHNTPHHTTHMHSNIICLLIVLLYELGVLVQLEHSHSTAKHNIAIPRRSTIQRRSTTSAKHHIQLRSTTFGEAPHHIQRRSTAFNGEAPHRRSATSLSIRWGRCTSQPPTLEPRPSFPPARPRQAAGIY